MTASKKQKEGRHIMSKKQIHKIIIIAIVMAGFLFFKNYSICYMAGNSMYPTIKSNTIAVYKKGQTPTYGDIVVIRASRYDEDETYIAKRVVALPNDTIKIANSKFFRNGEEIKEPYVKGDYIGFSYELHAEKMGKDEYFVMGDNRNSSKDSRDLGPIKREDIIGVFKTGKDGIEGKMDVMTLEIAFCLVGIGIAAILFIKNYLDKKG